MKYFYLQPSSNINEVGQFPQCPNAENFGVIQNIKFDLNREIKINFDLPIPIINKKAKLTTLLNVVPIPSWFLVLEKRFLSILDDFQIGSTQFWNLKCLFKGELISDYILFYISVPFDSKIIDYKSSQFYLGKHGEWDFKGTNLTISNALEYTMISEKHSNFGYIRTNKLVVDLSNINVDLFRLWNNPLVRGYIVSEKFKIAINKKGYTGMEFRPIDEIDSKIQVNY